MVLPALLLLTLTVCVCGGGGQQGDPSAEVSLELICLLEQSLPATPEDGRP